MLRLRWRFVCCIVLTVSAVPFGSALAAEGEFPFDRELMLDAAPMRGSKRIPIIEIAENGSASIQLWCTSVRGRWRRSARAVRVRAPKWRRQSLGRTGTGDGLAAPRRRCRVPRRHDAAVSTDDELKARQSF
jgi:hypothetical protein